MPEGDSILRLARRLAPALGTEPLRVEAPHPRGRLAGIPALDGRRLLRVDTHGKHLLLGFEGELTLHSHIAMTGAWRTFEPARLGPRTLQYAWASFRGGPLIVAQFKGPTLRVLTRAQLMADRRLRALGPDALGPSLDVDAVLTRIRRGDPGRPLAAVLLDQRMLAGPGLIYASEAPAAVHLHPLVPVGRLGDDDLRAVVEATRELMLAAVASGRQPRTVQSRAGRPCLRCGTPIAGATVGDQARRAYWCPRCQPAPTPSRTPARSPSG